MNNVFFENGFLTSTEAQNICNIAKEAVTNEHERLSAVSFYDTEIASIISPEAFIKTKISPNDISWISESLDKIGRYNALNAWLKEAIKAKEEAMDEVDIMDVTTLDFYEDYIKPEEPTIGYNSFDEEKVMNEWSADKLNRYYTLNSEAAVIGKYIHDSGAIAKARKDLVNKMANPSTVSGQGRETIVYKYIPSVDTEVVEGIYMSLLAKHRKLNAELNSLKAEIKETINKKNIEASIAFRDKHTEWEYKISEYYSLVKQRDAKINEYKISEKERISKLKINVPSSLMDTYKEIKALISE